MSVETKYTPGPWHVGLVDETSVLSADRETVALCCDRYEDDPERKAADARLIAAAPELYSLASNFEVTGPDADGLVWLVLHGNGTTGRAMVNLGTPDRLVVQVALHLEQDRKAALSKAGGPNVG